MSGTSPILEPAEDDSLDGLALARWISRLGVEVGSPCTFIHDGAEPLLSAWNRWVKQGFAPVLAPSLVAAYLAAGEGKIEELFRIDRDLDGALPGEWRERSLRVGRSFAAGKGEVKAQRVWGRFAAGVESGKSSGHAATWFALQAVLFHLPLAPALAAYLWFELENSLPATGYRDLPGTRGETLAAYAAALPEVAVAMEGDRGDFGEPAPRLRAL